MIEIEKLNSKLGNWTIITPRVESSFSIFLNDLTGQIFTLFILTVAAAEAAIGLAIIVVYYRNTSNIDVEKIQSLKG